MRSYFSKLLTSAWATKSEYFVLVGFLFGVVIAYLFSVPDVWAFTIGLAQIVGGFGVIFAVGVAVWQIKEIKVQATEEAKIAKEQADELVVRQEYLAAIRIYDELAQYKSAFNVMGNSLISVLQNPYVRWKVDKWNACIVSDPSGRVEEQFDIFVERLPKYDLAEVSILLAERSPEVFESVRHFQTCISFLTGFYVSLARYPVTSRGRYSSLIISQLQQILRVGPSIITTLIREYSVADGQRGPLPFPMSSWVTLIFSEENHIVDFALKNPPINWGGWEEGATEVWHAAGNTGALPIDERGENWYNESLDNNHN